MLSEAKPAMDWAGRRDEQHNPVGIAVDEARHRCKPILIERVRGKVIIL